MKRGAWFFAAALLLSPAWADQPVDPERFYRLTSELRCLVCQNESLADSDASLALDLKDEIRARMASGESNEQIKKFLVERYGNFVIYRPPFEASTLLLWLGPALLLFGGFFALWRGMGIGRRNEAKKDAREEPAP